MHVIQHSHVVSLPNDAPLPRGAAVIDPPAAYHEHPERYAVRGDRLVRRRKAEVQSLEHPSEPLKLTQEEIGLLKQAIAEGRLEGEGGRNA